MAVKEITKEQAMANYLECEVDDLRERSYDHCGLTMYDNYAIGTDEEADEAAAQYIKDTLWAFNASFIVSECSLDGSLAECIQTWQQEKCEDANDGIESLIENSCGIEEFIESAISADGRGHFMSSYDGNEIEQDGFYIYRIN